MAAAPEIIHATVIAMDGGAALLRGPSGAGKSDLALRCLAQPGSALLPGGVRLVADDRVELRVERGRLLARPPAAIAGLIEVRGLGVLQVPFLAEARVALVIDLVDPGEVERLPDPPASTRLSGVELPLVRLWPFEASAPVKVLLALALAVEGSVAAG